MPRTDLKVTLDGVPIRPALALGSWLAFQDMGDHAMVMGDLVLTHEEVNPVMKVLVENGLEVTALHNHLLRSSPATMYMHVGGHGDPVKLAAALQKAITQSKTPMGAASTVAPATPAPAIDTAGLDRTMGSATVINFQPTGGGKAAITGDFVLTSDEVNPVIRALRANGIEVTALHNHMLDDEPRLFFMHFWANDDALMLGRGLRSALDHVKAAKP
jgi:hypothetical protein